MIKKTLLSISLALCVLIVNGQSKISPYTQSFLLNHSTEKVEKSEKDNTNQRYVRTFTKDAIQFVDAFVEMNEGASTEAVVAQGATISSRMGDIITIQAPVDKLVAISELDEVKQVSVAKPVRLKNDKARTATKVSTLHQGTGFDKKFTGKDIVVGVVDIGIDVNHIAFNDQAGVSRVKKVYFPTVSGKSPAGTGVDGRAYPGSEYTTPAQISKLTTDTKTESHGTHTMSIAAGGYKGNEYYGMAPDADIVMVGTGDLNDVIIANGVSYIFDYAKSVNKPAVVNLSLGDNTGPHDGSSVINKYFDALADKGNIIVVSAGNEGADQLYISKTFSSATDQLKTFPIHYDEKSRALYGYIDAWGKTSTPIGIKAVVYNTTTKAIVYESKEFKPAGSSSMTINSRTDTNFAKYFTGTVTFASGVDPNGKYNSWCEFDAKIPNFDSSTAQPKYKFGLIYTSAAGAAIDVWADDFFTYLSGESITGWTNGNSSCSINNYVTTDNVISVGAYSTRKNFVSITGQTLSSSAILNDIADFSSYGVDMNGVSRPDVVGPGHIVLSAVNSFDANTVRISRNTLAAEVTSGGRNHHWASMSGTSMSSPAVAGIVALWLQADPMLDAAGVRKILNATSVKDSYVNRGNPVQWGAGKIDANAGLISILKTSGVEGVVTENNAVIIYPNPSNGQFTVYAQGETGNVTLSVYSTNGSLMTAKTFDASQGEINVDLSSELSSGLYIVQLIGEKVNHTSRLIIK